MGTSSSITVKVGNKFMSVYCHWDGYLDHVGRLLLENYNSQEKVEAIIALGDMSSLYESIDCPPGHSYDSKVKGFTVFYGRDRGEENTEARKFGSLDAAMVENKQEYNYFWNGEKWMVDGQELSEELIRAENE